MSVSGNERAVSKRGPAQYVLIETWDAGSAGGRWWCWRGVVGRHRCRAARSHWWCGRAAVE